MSSLSQSAQDGLLNRKPKSILTLSLLKSTNEDSQSIFLNFMLGSSKVQVCWVVLVLLSRLYVAAHIWDHITSRETRCANKMLLSGIFFHCFSLIVYVFEWAFSKLTGTICVGIIYCFSACIWIVHLHNLLLACFVC